MMTFLEALTELTQSIRDWVNKKISTEKEDLQKEIDEKISKIEIASGATAEEAAQIQQNKQDIETLNREKLNASELPAAVREYLEENPVAGGAGIVVSDSEPDDASVLWIDTDDNEGDNLQAAIDEAVEDALAEYLEKNPVMGGGFIASDVPPEDTSVLWVDLDDDEGDNLQAVIDEAVEDYMTEHPVEGGRVELDTSLTQSEKAADAKAVGDALNGKLSKSGGTMTGKIVFPTGDQNVGFANSGDMKIFGYGPINGEIHMRMGDTQYPFQIRGKGERAKYNDSEIALMGDIPDSYTKDQIDSIMGSYITDIDALIGGDS